MSCYHFVLGYAATVAAEGYAEVDGDLRECCHGHFGEGWMVQHRDDDVMI